MYLSKVCVATWIASVSSFTPSLQPKYAFQLQSSPPQDDSVLFGGSVPGMPDKPPPAPPADEDNPMGGQMFRQMMERAKKGPNRSMVASSSSRVGGEQAAAATFNAPPTQPVQQLGYPQPAQQYSPAQQPFGQATVAPAPVPPPQQGAMDPYAAYQAQLQAWQQQMNTFAQFSATNPQAAAQMTMPPPPPAPGAPVAPQQPPQHQPVVQTTTTTTTSNDMKSPYDYLPQGDGRNNQSFEVNNAADLYFAQLKRDSTIRTKARREGDLATANNPMADEGVKALGSLFSDELIASRRDQLKKNGGEFETSR